jgi:hypothetical protein
MFHLCLADQDKLLADNNIEKFKINTTRKSCKNNLLYL